MSVFVSGISGYIAKHIVDELLRSGYSVISSVRTQNKADNLVWQFGEDAKLTNELVPEVSKMGAFDEVFAKYGEILLMCYILHLQLTSRLKTMWMTSSILLWSVPIIFSNLSKSIPSIPLKVLFQLLFMHMLLQWGGGKW